MKIHSIYDNGGESIDRYTVYFKGRGTLSHFLGKTLRYALAMNDRPFHPQGFGQHCNGHPGRHNGKRIKFEQLPADCQRLVKQELVQE